MASSPGPKRMLSHDQYTVAWISPLHVERIAALAMLDEEHLPLSQPLQDQNVYVLGRIGNHNIVIAGLFRAGNVPAATAASQMTFTFPNLRFGLLVGIGGGVPFGADRDPVRLGDVVIGVPKGAQSGTIQYDYGKALAGRFEHMGMLATAPAILLNAAEALRMRRDTSDVDPVWGDILRVRAGRTRLLRFAHPGAANDHLYKADYLHREPGKTCDECGCDLAQRIPVAHTDIDDDSDDSGPRVRVHRGMIASGGMIIKDAMLRDRLAQQHGILCFEMEAAGVLHSFPCLVVRGISDYCDSHKNDTWHGFAAAAAAAYTRQLFSYIPFDRPANDSIPVTNSTMPTQARSAVPAMAAGAATAFLDQRSPESVGAAFQLPAEVAAQDHVEEEPQQQFKGEYRQHTDTSMPRTATPSYWADTTPDPGSHSSTQATEPEQWQGLTRVSKYSLALQFYESERYDEAEAWLSKIHNKEGHVLFLQSRVFSMQAKYHNAEDVLKRILERNEEAYSLAAYFELAWIYEMQEKNGDAKRMLYELVRRFRDKHREETDDSDTTEAKYMLGTALQRLDINKEADEFLFQVSKDWSIKYGDCDLKTLDALHFRGMALKSLGKNIEAEDVLQKAVDGRTKTLGLDNVDTLSSCHCLGQVLRDLDKNVEAAACLQIAASGRSKILGSTHIDTLASSYILGQTLFDLERYAEAEAVLRRAADGRSNILGAKNKDTLNSLYWLGRTLYWLGKTVNSEQKCLGAEQILRRTVDGQTEILGANHRSTLSTLSTFGYVLYALNKYADAEPVFQKVAEGRLQTSGKDTALTTEAFFKLSLTLVKTKKWNQAISAMRIGRDGMLRSKGKEHEKTLERTQEFGILLMDHGDSTEAETIFRDLVEIRTRTVGGDDQNTVWSIFRLGVVLMKRDTQSEEAEQLMRSLMEREKRGIVIPPLTLRKHAELLYLQGQLKEAQKGFSEVVDSCTASKGAGHEDTLEAQDFLGRVLYKQGKFRRAAKVFEAMADQRAQTLGEEHDLTKQARRRHKKAQLH